MALLKLHAHTYAYRKRSLAIKTRGLTLFLQYIGMRKIRKNAWKTRLKPYPDFKYFIPAFIIISGPHITPLPLIYHSIAIATITNSYISKYMNKRKYTENPTESLMAGSQNLYTRVSNCRRVCYLASSLSAAPISRIPIADYCYRRYRIISSSGIAFLYPPLPPIVIAEWN